MLRNSTHKLTAKFCGIIARIGEGSEIEGKYPSPALVVSC